MARRITGTRKAWDELTPTKRSDLVHKENRQLHDLLNQLADRIVALETNVEKYGERWTIRCSENRCGRREGGDRIECQSGCCWYLARRTSRSHRRFLVISTFRHD